MWLRTFYLLGLSSLLLLQSPPPLLARPQSSPESQGGTGQTTTGSRGLGTRTGMGTCAKGPPPEPPETPASLAEPEDANSSRGPVLKPIIPDDGIIRTQAGQLIHLYVYIPPETNRPATLTIWDRTAQSDYFFEANFELAAADAIARLVLPPDIAPFLTVDNQPRYTWLLTITCEVLEEREVTIATGGDIVRLPSTDAPPFWYEDTLDAWFAQRETDPTAWPNGLRRIGFGDYAQHPVQTYELVDEAEAAVDPTGDLETDSPMDAAVDAAPELDVSPSGAAES